MVSSLVDTHRWMVDPWIHGVYTQRYTSSSTYLVVYTHTWMVLRSTMTPLRGYILSVGVYDTLLVVIHGM